MVNKTVFDCQKLNDKKSAQPCADVFFRALPSLPRHCTPLLSPAATFSRPIACIMSRVTRVSAVTVSYCYIHEMTVLTVSSHNFEKSNAFECKC